MITFFATPKPFRGHIGIIQRNAIESWKRIHPDAEVILFGDEEGAAETARELGIRHIPKVVRNIHGTKFLTPIFDQAQEIARHNLLCYVNCDILLLTDFRAALEQVAAVGGDFLMAGQRWDVDLTHPLDFATPDWESDIRRAALEANRQRPPQWIDYFAFSRRLFYKNTPPFVIGRPGWDNWLLWCARASGVRVVDASPVIVAVHQNHDYSYHPDGEAGIWQGEEAQQNYALFEGGRCFATLENATHRLTLQGWRTNYLHWVVQAARKAASARSAAWFQALKWTRPLRHRLGMRQRRAPAVSAESR